VYFDRTRDIAERGEREKEKKALMEKEKKAEEKKPDEKKAADKKPEEKPKPPQSAVTDGDSGRTGGAL
jgi:hypothetical protein